ncbi:MAG: hypothetical protein J6C28_00880 [Bacilli bacterium]|nr:hypothetical protein [Bacilli bacterium]
MKMNTVKLLKYIAVVCVAVLFLEAIYIIYVVRDKSIYFDGINSIINVGNKFVAVGSNNNNDKFFEKAKITKYNEDKEKVFEKIYNKGYNGVFFDVIEDSDGNLIAVGSFESSEEDHLEGNRVGLIVKYDKDGNLLYENTYSVLDNSKFTSIDLVEDGYVVCGQSVYDNMVVGLSKDGGSIIVKYDEELNVEWTNNYGDNKSSSYNDILVYDNYIYTVGVTDSVVGIVSKYDFDGNVINTVRYENTDNLGFTGIVLFDEHLLVSGAILDSDKSSDGLLLKYNTDLAITKDIVYVSDSNERFNQIIIDKHNNVVVVGTSAKLDNSSSDRVNVYIHNGLIGKYDKNLEKVSVIEYGDDRDDYFTDVIISKGNYLVSGYSSYEDGSYLSKFITYSDALKTLEVE